MEQYGSCTFACWWQYMISFDMIWYDMIWHDMTWHDMTWYDMICLILFYTMGYYVQESSRVMVAAWLWHGSKHLSEEQQRKGQSACWDGHPNWTHQENGGKMSLANGTLEVGWTNRSWWLSTHLFVTVDNLCPVFLTFWFSYVKTNFWPTQSPSLFGAPNWRRSCRILVARWTSPMAPRRRIPALAAGWVGQLAGGPMVAIAHKCGRNSLKQTALNLMAQVHANWNC